MRFVWNTLHPILSGQIGWPPSMTTSEKCACICKKYVARKGHTCTNGVILLRFFFSAIDLLLHAIDFGSAITFLFAFCGSAFSASHLESVTFFMNYPYNILILSLQ
jgi:hypothetical protein